MVITEIEAVTLRVPVARPTRISTRVLANRDYTLVRARAGGHVGTGYTYAGTTGGTVVTEAVRALLAPAVVGRDAADIVGAWDAMYQESLLHGRRGSVMRAISAIDIALWDLAGQRADLPLANLLGGPTGPVPAYASGGYYRTDEGDWADAVRHEISWNLDHGFSDHKIKVGGLSVAQDTERVAAAVDAMAGRGRLALDANNAYRTSVEAAAALRSFEQAAGTTGIWWFEEPLSPDDLAGHAELRRTAASAIATGEIAASRWEFRDLLTHGSADILQPDAGVLGGITEYLRVAAAAATAGVPVAPHWHANLHAHLSAATTNGLTVEHFALEKDIYNLEALLEPDSRLAIEDGQVVVPDRPGIGVTFASEAIERFAV